MTSLKIGFSLTSGILQVYHKNLTIFRITILPTKFLKKGENNANYRPIAASGVT